MPSSTSNAGLLRSFISYAIGPGQQFGPALDFAPIPKVVLDAAKATIKKIQ